MKQLIIAAAAIIALASCSKEQPSATETSGGPEVTIHLQGEQTLSRAFFDNTAAAETWEKEVKSLTVYVFDASNSLVMTRSFNASELSARSARMTLPASTAGTTCQFYAVANADYGAVTATAGLNNRFETATLDQYNDPSALLVMNYAKRAAGFVMNGRTSAQIAATGSSTTVGVTLKRVVAKVAVRASVAPEFSSLYAGGTVVIENATIARANPRSLSFDVNIPDAKSEASLYSLQQTSAPGEGGFANLFYIYEESANASIDKRVLLTLTGFFDSDGLEATTDDRSAVEYRIVLDGSGQAKIVRNGYYRVVASIKGLTGDALTINFTVADWETPITQSVDLGV